MFYVLGRSSSTEASVVGGSLKETATEIDARGGKGIAVVCDHSNDEEVKALFTRIKQDHGRLDVLVNNAYAAVTVSFYWSSIRHFYIHSQTHKHTQHTHNIHTTHTQHTHNIHTHVKHTQRTHTTYTHNIHTQHMCSTQHIHMQYTAHTQHADTHTDSHMP